MYARYESFPNSCGISPESLFWETSSDSSSIRFAIDDGMWPVKALIDKLSTWSSFNRPMDFGISPPNLFPEKSIDVNILRIRTISISMPLFITTIESL
ncbi:unnamed protein product [Arabidopsis halleri]